MATLVTINQSEVMSLDRTRIMQSWGMAKGQCQAWHTSISHWRNLYDFNHFNYRPRPGETLYADPTYTNTVDLAVGVLLGNSMDFEAYGWTPSLQEEKGGSKIEKFLAGAISINSEREDYHIPYEIILNFVRDGAGCIYTVWDPDLAKRSQANFQTVSSDGSIEKSDVYTALPLRVQAIDPLKMYVIPGGKGRYAKMFRVEQMSVYDVEQMYGVTLERYSHLPVQDKLSTRLEFMDYWEVVEPPKDQQPDDYYSDKSFALQNAVMFGDEFVIPLRLMKGYDDYPYTLGFFKPVSRDKPEGWGHSIIRPMETTVEMLEKSVNRRSRQIDVYSALPMVSRTVAGRAVTVDPGMGNHVNLSLQEDIGFPQWPGNAPDVQQQIDYFRARVQQSGFSDVMYGTGASAGSGYALSQLGDQNRIRLTQPTEHLSLMFTNWAQKALALARNFANDCAIRVYGKLKGSEFADHVRKKDLEGYRVAAIIHPVFPNEEVRKHAMATQVKGILSEHTIMQKYLGVKQPDEERSRRIQEQAVNHPIMQQYIMIAALKELSDGGDKAAGLTLQMMQQQGPPGQPGRPGEPNAPEQPIGLQSSTGEATPQAGGAEPPGQSAGDQFGQMMNASPNMSGMLG